MRRSRMLPPAVRWLCIFFLTVQGVRGQLSVGDPDSFLLEDLEPTETTAQPEDTLVGEGPNVAIATELPPDESTLVGLEDAVTIGGDITPEAISALEDIISGVGEFGSRISSDAVEEEPGDSAAPQLTRRILVSGTLPTTPSVPEPTATFTRPSSVVRVLTDPHPGWLPNWPSELLQSNGITRRPTIRFPSDSPLDELESTPTVNEDVPTSVVVASIAPSLVVSKVPVTQYFFDITSAAPTSHPGPLFDPDELSFPGSGTSGVQGELHRPVIELASSIPELQSSAFIPTADLTTVTPTLPGSEVFTATEAFADDTNIIESTPVATPTFSLIPSEAPPSIETEVVNNELPNENNSNITTLVSGAQDETSESQPPKIIPDEDDEGELTTVQDLLDTTSPISPTDPIADLPEDLTGTGAVNPDPSATSSSPFTSESELAPSHSTDSVEGVKPTSLRSQQAGNASRTPLWMLLSKSVPSQSLPTESLRSTLTTPVISLHTADSLANTDPTATLTDIPREVSTYTDLVSSVLISSKLTSVNSEPSTVFTDTLNTKTLVDEVSSLDLADSSLATRIPSSAVVTEPSVSLSSIGDIAPSVEPNSVEVPTPLPDLLDSDLVEPSDFISPLTPITSEKTTDLLGEHNDSSVAPQESDAGTPSNTTVEYHEGPNEPLIVTVAENDPMHLDSLSAVGKDTHLDVSPTVDGDTWTPVVEVTEKATDIQSTPSSVLINDSTPLNLITPDLTGGFIPITSETLSAVIPHTELMPENANISITTAATAIVASTAAPAESFVTQLEYSPSITDPSSIQESSLVFESISPSERPHSEELPVSTVIFKDGLVSSNLLLSTTTFPAAKSDPTSVSLTPSFNVSVSSSESPSSINLLEFETVTTTAIDLEPSMIIPEILLPSSAVLETETLPSTATSSSILSLSTETMDVSAESSVVSVIPLSTATPILPEDPISSAFSPLPSSSSSFPNTDLSTLVTPTVHKETFGDETILPLPEDAQGGEEETSTKDSPPKGTDEGAVGGGVMPDETFTLTTSPAPPSVPPTTTEKDTTAKPPTEPPSSVTSPVPTTPQSTITVTNIYPTESMPTLTTSVTFPNGTVFDRPLPYLRALVAYNEREFCKHKQNFRAMLAEWISKHLKEETSILPSEIEFFNMPQCDMPKPSPEDHFNLLPEVSGTGLEDKLNTSLDSKEVTNVYFYVTSAGKINPNLTENFPLFPMELQISEELTYLRAKVSQLELVRPDGSTDTSPLPDEASLGNSVVVIIVTVTIVAVVIIIALICFMVVKKRGSSNNYYGRRCTPVSMDAYSMDSVSVYHSFRRKSKRRASGRSVKSYLNQAFDDPNGPSRPLNFAKLTHFISDIDGVHEEFATIPVNMPKYDELPAGVEDKNRYANVIPVPETRVLLKCLKDSSNSEYINANYVRGPRNESKYYIATQAPLEDTVADFWRMIWEQETRVVVMLTDFVEKGIDKCADYLPPSETLDCHRLYGDFQVTLKSRDMREKYVVSNVQLKNLENNLVREIAHMWFTGWPASGVPNEETAFISYILEIRRTRKKLRAKGPILVHCSPGTGRSGTFLACDLVMRQFEEQRNVDVPRTVYSIRRDRAGSVQTKEQYAFIYRVINLYASKLTTGNLDSL